MRRILVGMLAMLLIATAVPARSSEHRDPGDTRVFARIAGDVPPEGIAVRDGTVYVGTHVSLRGNAGGAPSKVFALDRATGSVERTYVVEGQDTSVTHGILGMRWDADGNLYIADRAGRIVRLDPSTGAQSTYATLPSLPACRPTGPTTGCSPTTLDQATFADDLTFDAEGNAYVTDLEAAAIYRVPPGGGQGTVWFSDPRLDGVFGPNGISIDPSGEWIYFAMSFSQTADENATRGIIYRLPVVNSPQADDLEIFATLGASDGPDGIAFGASGNLYVALAGTNGLAVLDPDGTEVARFPASPAHNQLQEVPYDMPASLAFDGEGALLVTNQSYFASNSANWVVFDVWVDDVAATLPLPSFTEA